jgi:hypothetical protein
MDSANFLIYPFKSTSLIFQAIISCCLKLIRSQKAKDSKTITGQLVGGKISMEFFEFHLIETPIIGFPTSTEVETNLEISASGLARLAKDLDAHQKDSLY